MPVVATATVELAVNEIIANIEPSVSMDVIESKDDVVVVCRGTEVKEWNDIRADLSIALTPSRTGIGKVHRGFRTYTDKIWEPIKSHISPIKNKDIWFTGHSLGAAMATLMARRCVLDISMRVPTLFTYGSPRVGNRAYINEFNSQITHHRWVNDGDIVTKVPFVPFYYHCGTMHHIGSDGKVAVEFDRKISCIFFNKVYLWFDNPPRFAYP